MVDTRKKILIDGRKIASQRSRCLFSQEDLAEAAGVSVNTIKRIEPTRSRSILVGTARRIASALKVPPELVGEFFGVGTAEYFTVTEIPLYTVSAARTDQRAEEADESVTVLAGPPHRVAVKIVGECMQPKFPHGGVAVCDWGQWKEQGFVDGKVYWIRFSDGETTFKRVRLTSGDELVLIPDNRKFPPMTRRLEDVVSAARATEVILFED